MVIRIKVFFKIDNYLYIVKKSYDWSTQRKEAVLVVKYKFGSEEIENSSA
jgi:hypothetical protein